MPRIYSEIRPNGVEVTSTVPFVEPRWWDNPVLHIVWSYSSWITMILKHHGHPGPRRWFDKHMQRPNHG